MRGYFRRQYTDLLVCSVRARQHLHDHRSVRPSPLQKPLGLATLLYATTLSGPAPARTLHDKNTGRNMFSGLSGHRAGILFLVAVILAFAEGGLWAARKRVNASFPDDSLIPRPSNVFRRTRARPEIHEHPIPKLMSEAETRYRNLLGKQSKTLPQAVAEYKRRYGRNPPRGFDDWWRFAQENNVVMIDEYNNINEDLAPFWTLSGEQMRERATAVRTHASLYCPQEV